MRTSLRTRIVGAMVALAGVAFFSMPARAAIGPLLPGGSVAAQQAPLIVVEGGRTFALNSLNDFLPGAAVKVGAQLSLAADATLTFHFLGAEAAYNNIFEVAGTRVFENSSISGVPFNLYGSYTTQASAGLLDFAFLINGDPGTRVHNRDNAPGILPSFAVLALLPDHVFLLLDDYGALDADYDDMIIMVSATAPGPIPPVPEPQTWGMMLGGLGVLGVVLARRRRETRH